MGDTLNKVISKKDQEEIKEFISTLLLLPQEDKAVLLSNAYALRVRRDIERAREKWKKLASRSAPQATKTDSMNKKNCRKCREVGKWKQQKNPADITSAGFLLYRMVFMICWKGFFYFIQRVDKSKNSFNLIVIHFF